MLHPEDQIPIKAEEESANEELTVPHIVAPVSAAVANSPSHDQPHRANASIIVPTDSDAILSFPFEPFKGIMDIYINEYANMKERNEEIDINEGTEEVLNSFRERIQRGNGRYLKCLKRSQGLFEELDEDAAREKIHRDLLREPNVLLKKRKSSIQSPKNNAKVAESPANKKAKPAGPSASRSTPSANGDDHFGVRPRRGTQRPKEKKMKYREDLESNLEAVGRNIFEYKENPEFNVRLLMTRGDKLACFGQFIARELKITLDGVGWNSKYCEVGNDEWEFVVFRGCNNCNENMYNAVEGETKFTGYAKLAEFIIRDGLEKHLPRSMNKLNDFLKEIDLELESESNPRPASAETVGSASGQETSEQESSKHTASPDYSMRQSTTGGATSNSIAAAPERETKPHVRFTGIDNQNAPDAAAGHGNIFNSSQAAASLAGDKPSAVNRSSSTLGVEGQRPDASNSNMNNSTFASNSPASSRQGSSNQNKENSPSTASNTPAAGMSAAEHDRNTTNQNTLTFVAGYRRVRNMSKQIIEKLASAKTRFDGFAHTFKYEKSVAFYNGLHRWLTGLAGDRKIASFEPDTIQGLIEDFESIMEDLVDAEESNSMDIDLNKHMISALVEHIAREYPVDNGAQMNATSL